MFSSQVRLRLKNGETVDRFPAYLLRATQQQNPPESKFRARMKKLPPRYKGVRLPIPRTLRFVLAFLRRSSSSVLTRLSFSFNRIYEAHIGVATSQDDTVGTFAEFERDVLPRVKSGGYNTLQLFVRLPPFSPPPVSSLSQKLISALLFQYGHHGTSLLRVLRLSGLILLRRFVSIRFVPLVRLSSLPPAKLFVLLQDRSSLLSRSSRRPINLESG